MAWVRAPPSKWNKMLYSQEVSTRGKLVDHIGTKSCKWGIQPSLETQGRRYQKSSKRVPVPTTKRTCVLTFFLKKEVYYRFCLFILSTFSDSLPLNIQPLLCISLLNLGGGRHPILHGPTFSQFHSFILENLAKSYVGAPGGLAPRLRGPLNSSLHFVLN